MRMAVIGVASLALAGCATTAATPPTPPSAVTCDATRAQAFVGQPGETTAPTARRATGARNVRIIRPGDAVTMDYREDRLNLELDVGGMIVSARCG